MKESAVRCLLHDLRSRIAAQLTQAVIAEYHRPAAYLRVGYEKIAILAVKLADDGVDKGVLWRYMTTSDRHCQ